MQPWSIKKSPFKGPLFSKPATPHSVPQENLPNPPSCAASSQSQTPCSEIEGNDRKSAIDQAGYSRVWLAFPSPSDRRCRPECGRPGRSCCLRGRADRRRNSRGDAAAADRGGPASGPPAASPAARATSTAARLGASNATIAPLPAVAGAPSCGGTDQEQRAGLTEGVVIRPKAATAAKTAAVGQGG